VIRAAAVTLAVLLALAAPAQACTARTSVTDLEDEVMCTVCGLPLSEATESPQAQRERALIARLAARCADKPAIKRRLVAEYGPAVLATPPGGGFDVSAWAVPLLALAGLALGLTAATGIWRPRRRARS
jgi:cytochrome c-type biogenesis protein CcmH/NrfF